MDRSAHLPTIGMAMAGRTAPGVLPATTIAADCRHYRGDRPCFQNRLCLGCERYEPYEQRVCVIKLGALGDVIRTLGILPELRRRYPRGQVTWVTLPNACRMLANHPMIDRLLPFDPTTVLVLGQERFGTVISLDKEAGPCALAMSLLAGTKLGVGLSEFGTPIPLNEQAGPYFHLGLSDELKFRRNTKSYLRLVYEALGWEYRGQRYELPVNAEAAVRVRKELERCGWRPDRPTLGVNVGAGRAFANKMWPVRRVVEVVRQVRDRWPHVQVLLLGGPEERRTVHEVLHRLRRLGVGEGVVNAGTHHSEVEFVAVVDRCDAVFCGDTMAMHVAIALGKKVVAVFGPTCEQEIDLFGEGQKLVATVPCAPCYKRVCDHDDACVYQIDARDAADAIGGVMSLPVVYSLRLSVAPLRKAG
jgi:heptosyltransferase-2